MTEVTIDQFMWAFQHTFRMSTERDIQQALSLIGLQIHDNLKVLLIGLATRDDLRHQICIEPEQSPLVADDLRSIAQRTHELIKADPQSGMTHSNRRLHQKLQHALYLRCRADAIAKSIHKSGKFSELSFFVSNSAPIAGYEVHTCIGIPTEGLESVPRFANPNKHDYYKRHIEESLVHALINTCLAHADKALRLPYPGEDIGILGDRIEMVRTSASRFADGVAYAIAPQPTDLFRSVTDFSSLTYERSGAKGHFVVTSPDNLSNKLSISIQSPVYLNQPRTVRKLLELTDDTNALLTDGHTIYGIGECNPSPDVATVTIDGHAKWSLCVDGTTLMKVAYEHATLPKQILDKDLFSDVAHRTIGAVDVQRIWNIFQCALDNGHGSTIVVSEDPMSEIERLGQEALAVKPEYFDHRQVAMLGRIDGAIILGPDGRCYAFGAILDGLATSTGDRARGARFNSSIRYQKTAAKGTLVIVISDDGTVDLIPSLLPRVSHQKVEEAVRTFCEYSAVKGSDSEEWARRNRRVEELTFYLSQEQCDRVNEAYEKEMDLRLESGGIQLIRNRLQPDPNMDDSYFRD